MTLVIGIGNPDRGDDAVGLAVARQVRAAAPAGVTVMELDGDQIALLDAWGSDSDVYVVDATCSGAEPGRVFRFDAATPLGGHFSGRGTHLFSLAEVIELARALHQLPARLTGFGIEGAAYELGTPLSAAAEDAARTVAEQILRELRAGT
ncbi:MAG TPA: hydrogenase maturation protease [Trebonia sp.]